MYTKATIEEVGISMVVYDIKKEITTKGLQDYITMTGYINNIYRYLSGIDVFLISSETEGLGTSILDAFAAGIPVVATNAGGIPEIVKHRGTGLIADVKDYETLSSNLNEIINNDNLREALIMNALEFVKSFDKKFTAKKTLNIYKELI